MLGKLFKYDFKWINNKVMFIYYSVFLIITILVKAIESFEQTILMVVVDKILSGMFISCFISIIITCFMRIWARFIDNFYKDSSYLTHTLPVTKDELFNSKVLASIASLIIAIIIVLLGAFYVFLGDNGFDTLKIMYQSLIDAYNSSFAFIFVIGLILLVLLEVLFFMFSGIFGIIIGHRFNNYKMFKSIAIGIGSYLLLSIIMFMILSLIGNYADINNIVDGFPPLNTVKVFGGVGIITYLVFDIAYYFMAKNIFNKGVNVD